ncbi:MAG TPA: MFS transporter [Acidobacteriaceae bacterium]|nr:MFS transporter [Acidobacteriaceae bacterium]
MSCRRWRIAWLLGLGVLISYIDRVNISVGQQALHHAFGLSMVAFGFLLSAYSWTYAAMQLPSGVLLDKFGIKRVGVVGSFIWSMATFATAASTGVVSLFSSRFLLGIGEAPIFPMNAKAIGAWFPERERGLPTAIFDSAAKFSAAVGIPLVGMILLHFGWRLSFAFTGVLSLLYFLLFACIYRNPTDDPHLCAAERAHIEDEKKRAGESATETCHSLGSLARQRKIVGLTIGFATYNYSYYLLLTWLPTYLAAGLHLSPVHAVWAASIPWFFAGTVDLAVGGWLVDDLIRRGRDAGRVRQTVLLLGMICGLGVAAPAFTHRPVLALLVLSIGLAGLSASAPIAWSLPSILVSPANTGKAGGIMNFGTQFAAISAPIITGYLTHWTHSFAAAFALAAVLQLGGIAAYALLLGKIERIEMVPPELAKA